MKNYFEEIKKKIKKNIKIEEIQVIDNSHLHKGHKFFSPERYHLKLIIKSEYLKSLPLIKAQKQVMNILKEDFKTKIHALEINIEK
tara:strand:+ start:201 stop:458 length:258 start_codon:yes stop_codon:yes gene_type:complete